VELTEDLYKAKKEYDMESQMHCIENKAREFTTLQDEMNGQIITQQGWGHNNDGLPSLMKNSAKNGKTSF